MNIGFLRPSVYIPVINISGQCPEEHTFSASSARVENLCVLPKLSGPFYQNTSLHQLPYAVMNILQNKLDYGDKWKDLASHLGMV